MQLDFAIPFEFALPAQGFAQHSRFDLELMLVAGVLVVASAAALEIWTARLDARDRGTRDFLSMRAHEAALLVECFGLHLLAFKDERQEDRATVRHSRQSVTAIDELFDGEEQGRIEKFKNREI